VSFAVGQFGRGDLELLKTGLLDRFRGRIFSVDDVENGKPAPQLVATALTIP
jgi:beta-phosphoglucomutase-like phosphatase (HAD superfamily)